MIRPGHVGVIITKSRYAAFQERCRGREGTCDQSDRLYVGEFRRTVFQEHLDDVEVQTTGPRQEDVSVVPEGRCRRGDHLPDRQFQRGRTFEVRRAVPRVVVR